MSKLRFQRSSAQISPLPNGTAHEVPNGVSTATNDIEGMPISRSVTEGEVNRVFVANEQNCVNNAATNSNHNSDISPSSNSNSSIGGRLERTDQHVHNGGVRLLNEPDASITENELMNSPACNPGTDNENSISQQQTRLHNDMNEGTERPPPYNSTASVTPTSDYPKEANAPEASAQTPSGNATRDGEEGEFDVEVREKVSDPPATKPIISPLLILTAMTGSFAHGGNDVRCVCNVLCNRAKYITKSE